MAHQALATSAYKKENVPDEDRLTNPPYTWQIFRDIIPEKTCGCNGDEVNSV
jgi:hypothetical protein